MEEQQEEFNRQLLAASPTLRQWGPSTIEWLSPAAASGYKELRDSAWGKVGLSDDSPTASGWWPARGPVWDAVGRATRADGLVAGIFVEAKGRKRELRGRGTRALGDRRKKIRDALAEVQLELDVTPTETWLERIYQPANRLAFLWYARQRLKPAAPVWLASVYFLGERYTDTVNGEVGPASKEEWAPHLDSLYAEMGFSKRPADLVDWWPEVFLPALRDPTAPPPPRWARR